MNLKETFLVLVALLTAIIGVFSISTEVTYRNTKETSNDDLIRNFFFNTTMDEHVVQLKYYKDGEVRQDPLFPDNISLTAKINLTAEDCMESIVNSENTTDIHEFYKNIASYEFVNDTKCIEYQKLWTKIRSETDCYETIKLGTVSNIDIRATTLADPKIFSIVEKFMKEVVFKMTSKVTQSRGLKIDDLMVDRPSTYMYLLLETIRHMYPSGIAFPLKVSMKEAERLINRNIPLFKKSRDMNERRHSVDMLFLSKKDDTSSVENIQDLGIAFIFIDGEGISGEKLILNLVWENSDPLFEVCRDETRDLNN